MTTRDIVTIGIYGLVFSSVVALATLQPTTDDLAASSGTLRSSFGVVPLERSEGLAEMRRVVQHTMLR